MKYQRSNVLNAGRYLAKCKSAVEKLSKSGSDMIEMIWTVEDGGNVVEVKSFLTAKMGWIIDQLKSALGIELGTERDSDITAEVLVGKYALIDVECDQYRDQMQNKIVKYLPYEGQIPENAVTPNQEDPF